MAREARADAPGLALAAGAGMLATSLLAPWAHSWRGTREMVVGFEVLPMDGWARLGGGRAVAVALVAAFAAVLAAWRLSGRRAPRAIAILGATAAVAVAAWVASTMPFGVETTTHDPTQFATLTEPSLREGPLVAAIGALLALAGLLAGRAAPACRAGGRGVALVLCGGLLLVALSLRWSGDAFPGDPGTAWKLYAWADAGLALIAALVALSAAVPRHPALVALPIAALALPFLDRGISHSYVGGFAEPMATEGSAVGTGAWLALAAMLIAGVATVRRPQPPAASGLPVAPPGPSS